MTNRVEHLAEGVTILLGDAREIVPSLGIIDTLVSDPPYGMSFRSNFRKVRHEAIENDSDESALLWACALPVKHSRYVFCRWDNLGSVPKPKSMVTWVKNNWSMGDLEHEHARQTEVALFYPGPEHRFPKGRPNDVILAPRTGNEHHPSKKPVQLMMAVAEWTIGTILDPFCGSGSTGVAAVRLGRPFIGVELDPIHFDTACRRLEKAVSRPDMFAATPRIAAIQEGFAL